MVVGTVFAKTAKYTFSQGPMKGALEWVLASKSTKQIIQKNIKVFDNVTGEFLTEIDQILKGGELIQIKGGKGQNFLTQLKNTILVAKEIGSKKITVLIENMPGNAIRDYEKGIEHLKGNIDVVFEPINK